MSVAGAKSLPSVSPHTCLASVLLLLAFSGCALVPDVKHKPVLNNPFPQIKTVAILPFANQSEEPTLSGERVALAYANELQAVRGFEVLPLGAVRSQLAGYQGPLQTGPDFQAFARHLGVDVVLIGAITDYEAYYPPRMSLKVNWYAANPGFHPVLPGYGLPWGTSDEKKIPAWIQQEAQRALAAEQLKTQTPADPMAEPIMPEDRRLLEPTGTPEPTKGLQINAADSNEHSVVTSSVEYIVDENGMPAAAPLPPNWPDPRGFIPDAPTPERPEFMPQNEPIISHMRNFNGHDEDFTEQLAEYFYYRDDARFGGWQAYLQRSEDFIRFCCHLHLSETLALRGGEDKSRLILRWPIDRYSR